MNNLLDKITSFEQPFGDTSLRKNELKQVSDGYKQVLDDKIADLKIDASRIGKQALVIGGSIATVYLLLELLLPDDESEIKNVPSNGTVVIERKSEHSWLAKGLQSMAMTALLALAKQKLEDFLENQTEINATESTDTNPAE